MSFALVLYNLLLLLATLFLSPVIGFLLLTSAKVRSGFLQKLSFWPQKLLDDFNQLHDPQKTGQKPLIWFHTVSVGEFNATFPLLCALSQQGYRLCLSTTTRTGQNLAKQRINTQLKPEQPFPIFYFPYDFRPVLNKALDRVRPDMVVIAETELWPNFIDLASRKRGIPVTLINGRISPGSFKGYRWIRPLIKPMLRQFHSLFMQSNGDAERITALGAAPEKVKMTGNIKFDLAPFSEAEKAQSHLLKTIFNIQDRDKLLVFASTHDGEEALLLDTFIQLKRDFPTLKLVLAPRHPERVPAVRTLLNSRALGYVLRSHLDANPEAILQNPSVIVLDTIGELKAIFDFAQITVMGGSFVPVGGHNPLEAISQKVPVIFGPHMFNFPEISRLVVESHAGYQVQSTEELVNSITQLFTHPETCSHIVENGQALMEKNRGTTQKLVKQLQMIVA